MRTPKTNVAPSAASFVGRAGDLAAIQARFDEGARIVTLLGPGGIGKTRVASRFVELAAADYAAHGGGGAWLIDVAGAKTVADACAAVASALDIRLARDVEELARALGRRGRMLLVLDNCELAPHAGAVASALLRATPRTSVLVTSRVALEIAGEHLLPLDPLPPDDAVRLFLDRARQARPGLEPTEADLASIADVVRRVDHIPLAIELAAARASVLTPAQIASRLSPSLPLLVRRGGGAGDRHASMRTTIADSFEMLAPDERTCLAALSVFRGGFTLEAAEVVAGGGGGVLGRIDALRSRSLLRAFTVPETPSSQGQSLRFALYEPIREFAAGHLASDGPRRRHLAFFAGLGAATIARIVPDLDNLLAAHETALERRDGGAALALALAVDPVFRARGHLAPRARILDASLAVAHERDAAFAEVLVARGHTRRELGQVADARRDLDDALSLAESLGATDIAALARIRLGELVELQGDTAEARAFFERAIATSSGTREAEARTHLAHTLRREGRLEEADAELARAIAIHRARRGDVEDDDGLSHAVFESGAVALFRRRYDEAAAAFDETLALARRAGSRQREGDVLAAQGTLLRERGDIEGALACYGEALAIFRHAGDPYSEGSTLYYLAGAYLERGQGADAAALLGQALALVCDVSSHRYEALVRACRATILADEGRVAAARVELDAARAAAAACASEPSLEATIGIHAAHVERGAASIEAARALADAHRCDDPRFALRVLLRSDVRVGPVLVVRADARAFRAPGASADVELSRRAPLRRILAALAEKRSLLPGGALALDELIAAAWPGERIAHTAGINRAHVALAELRKLGLRDVLVTTDDGYCLTPSCGIVIER